MDVSAFIEALGGTTKAAKVFNVLPSAVSNWRTWNRLPPRVHLRAVKEASKRGFVFDPEAPSKPRKRAA